MGFDADVACARFYETLDQLYSGDLPLAKAKDNSDLLLHVEGRAVEDAPRISLVSSLFNNVKGQVRDLTKAISGILPDRRVTVQQIDLGLSGLAKGSLFVGFSVPLPRERGGHENLLGEQDPLFKATKDALRIINAVSHSVEFADEQEAPHKLAEVVDDPRVRDAALVAVRRIAPSGKTGVSRIGVTSASDMRGPAVLTPYLRSQIGRMLERPVESKERMEFVGIVREIDLDAKRFELRGIADQQIHDIRCAYGAVKNLQPRGLLDARVRVQGVVERRADEAPRLMSADYIELLSAPTNEQSTPLDMNRPKG
ncbi:MAG: hypothetical protein E5V71_00280 [Mesorhizobium sp.]|nr:MAG: hypothetical protein E5V71_00280 [Mesorhizobium sp.]